MKAIELRQQLITILGTELGQFGDGSPAIHVEGPELDFDGDEGVSVTGILCVIQAVPGGAIADSSYRQRHHDKIWNIRLINFDLKKSLKAATDKVLHSSLDLRRYIPVSGSAKEGIRESCRFEVLDPEMVNLER